MGNFSGKTVVVTGASAGLGRAIVNEFAKNGANLALIARGNDRLTAAKEEVEHYGGKVLAFPIDVSDAEAVEEAAKKTEKELGAIDVWVNNAMVSVFGPFQKVSAEEFKRVTEVTYLGQVYGTASALKRMRPRNKGSIILVGSALAYRGIPLQSAYCGAKHGIHGFFESLRSELIHDRSGIHLGMVQMPAMNTPQFSWVKSYLKNKPKPMGLIYQPEVGARAVVEMARNHQRELHIGTPTIKTILGNKVLPGFLDNYLAKTGYKGQQTNERDDKNRANNLWKPREGDFGAHGNFDKEACGASIQGWATTHKELALGLTIGLSLLLGVWIGKRKRKEKG